MKKPVDFFSPYSINAFLKFLSLIGVNIIQIKHTKANLDSEAKKIVNLSKNKLLLIIFIGFLVVEKVTIKGGKENE